MAAERELPDEELLRRFRGGDTGALRILFERHEELLRARIRQWVPQRLKRRFSVSDVLQETRLVAMRCQADFEDRGEGSFKRWLAGIAEMKARRAVQWHTTTAKRASGREVSHGHRPDTEQFAAREPSPSEAAMASEEALLARRAMDRLPGDYRRVLRLVHEEHLTYEEAAARMGRSSEAIRKLYGRALERLTQDFDRLTDDRHE